MIRKYPGVLLLAFIITGIIIADQTHIGSGVFLLATVLGCAGGFMALAQHRQPLAVFLFVAGIGAFSGFNFGKDYYDTGPHHLKNVVKETQAYHIYGRVADWPELKPDRTEIRIALDSLRATRTRRVSGSVMLKVTEVTTALQRGDRVEFYGRIYPVGPDHPSEPFDYNRYLKLKSVFGVVYLSTLHDVRVDRRVLFGIDHLIDRLRSAVTECLKRNLEPCQAALAGGFLIGETRDIPHSVYAMFRDSGTLHLLAVSGSNVALVLLFITSLMRPFRVSPLRRAIVLAVVIIVFAELSYEEPSVIRASIMAVLVIAAGLLGRRYDLNNLIAFTAVLILLYQPAQLYDVGFQLSFVTAWGLILGVPRVSKMLDARHRRKWYRWLILPVAVSLIAQVVSTPIIAFHFGRVPIISVVANLAVVVLVSAGVIGILVMLVADLVWPILGLSVGTLVNFLLKVVVWVLHLLGGENMLVWKTGGIVTDELAPWLTVAAYVVLLILLWSIGTGFFRKAALFCTLVVVNLGLLARVARVHEDQECRMDLRTVPGGVAVLIHHSQSALPDLVLTGLDGRDWEIDQTLLIPWMEDRGVERVGSVFALMADFGAIDDILRTARACGARVVRIPDHLIRSFGDVLHADSSLGGVKMDTMSFYGAPPDSPVKKGYCACSIGLVLTLDHAVAIFTDRVTGEHYQQEMSGLSAFREAKPWLIVGRKWSPAPSDWIALEERGYDHIVCSKIALPSGSSNTAGLTGMAEPLPEYLHDLNCLGPIEISLGGERPLLVR